MQNYQSTDVDDTQYNGLCCADSVSSLRQYIAGYFENDDQYEIVVFKGRQTDEIYDGVVARPISEIARTNVRDFMEDDKWYEYEEW